MFAVQLGMAWGGPLLESDSKKRRESKLRLLFKSFPGAILKSGVGPLARYGYHLEIVSGRPEQMYTLSDTRLEWPEGHYSSRTQINAGTKTGPLFESLPRPLLKSGPQPLGRYGTHQETISRRPEQMYPSSDTRLDWPRRHYLIQT